MTSPSLPGVCVERGDEGSFRWPTKEQSPVVVDTPGVGQHGSSSINESRTPNAKLRLWLAGRRATGSTVLPTTPHDSCRDATSMDASEVLDCPRDGGWLTSRYLRLDGSCRGTTSTDASEVLECPRDGGWLTSTYLRFDDGRRGTKSTDASELDCPRDGGMTSTYPEPQPMVATEKVEVVDC